MANKVQALFEIAVKGQNRLAKAQGSVERFGNVSMKAAAGLRTLGTAGAVFAGYRLAKTLADTTMQLEAMTFKMKAAVGPFSTTNAEMSYAEGLANRLGHNVINLTQSYAGFSAAALRSGLSLETVREIFTNITETATSLKISNDRTKLVFLALEQMASKGVVSMEELRRQMGENLPGALEIAAQSMGMTTREFNKAVSSGNVLSSEFLPKFARAIREELGGSVEEASNSLQANLNRAGNAFFELKVAATKTIEGLDANPIQAFTSMIQGLTAALENNEGALAKVINGTASLLSFYMRAIGAQAQLLGGIPTDMIHANDAIASGDSDTITDLSSALFDKRARILKQISDLEEKGGRGAPSRIVKLRKEAKDAYDAMQKLQEAHKTLFGVSKSTGGDEATSSGIAQGATAQGPEDFSGIPGLPSPQKMNAYKETMFAQQEELKLKRLEIKNEIETQEREITEKIRDEQQRRMDQERQMLESRLMAYGMFGERLGSIIGQNMGKGMKGMKSVLKESLMLTLDFIQAKILAEQAAILAGDLAKLGFAGFAAAATKIAAVGAAFGLAKAAISRFEMGTPYAPGGMAMVGERGPEMMYVPRGAQIMPSSKTQEVINNNNSVNGITMNIQVANGDALMKALRSGELRGFVDDLTRYQRAMLPNG